MSSTDDLSGTDEALPFAGILPYVAFGRELLAVALEAAENGEGLSIDLVGCGYVGPYRAAAEDDRHAIAVRDAINHHLQRLLGPPPTPAGCFLCTEPLHTPERDTAIVVAVRAAVPTPASICCAAICTQCSSRLSDYGELLSAIMRRYGTWLPELRFTQVAEPGHA